MFEPLFLGITESTCPVCRSLVPTKLLGLAGDLYFEKFCPEHGPDLVFVRADVDDYVRTLRYVKAAVKPRTSAGDAQVPCPSGCGFCERHEQHLCLPIVEITQRCDLACPVCLVDAQGESALTVSEFSFILDQLLQAEPQIDILNLSGGEPLTHPDLLALIDHALSRPEIIRVSISTNGLAFLQDKKILTELRERDVVVSLQFDGFHDRIYEILRGRPLWQKKRSILDLLIANNITTSLTVTAARAVNEHEFAPLLELLFSTPNIVSMMIQPLVYEGRARQGLIPEKRLTLPEIIRLLGQTGLISESDFTPLPCCHPACFSLAFYVMLNDGRHTALGKLIDAPTWLDTIANKAIFGLEQDEYEQIKGFIYNLWSGPAANNPDSEAVLSTIRQLLREINKQSCSCFDPRVAFAVGERKIKSIFIHAFQDVDTFDLARVRRCCNGYPQKDGRVIPACVYNVLQRHEV
ncbi:radical SAM protein [candidate division CSSED10-310 bacterium]|uniref:Radical SAM protein n=1 Tax=candidate division CSSED10-310 bacterium TaxID=2855610 RepID=A0ABV6YYZ8_UNCC1